jgi:hypothetical protein
MLWQHLGVNKLLKEAYESGTVSDVRLDVKNRNCLSLDRPERNCHGPPPAAHIAALCYPHNCIFRK